MKKKKLSVRLTLISKTRNNDLETNRHNMRNKLRCSKISFRNKKDRPK